MASPEDGGGGSRAGAQPPPASDGQSAASGRSVGRAAAVGPNIQSKFNKRPSIAPPVERAAEHEQGRHPIWLDHFAPWMTSSIVHALFLIVLALFFVGGPFGEGTSPLSIDFSDDNGSLEPEKMASIDAADDSSLQTPTEELDDSLLEPVAVEMPKWPQPVPLATSTVSIGAAVLTPRLSGGLAGRQPANRRELALANGGTPDSEEAVELGLAWLAAHQFEDGGWRFGFRLAPQCDGSCRDQGNLSSTTGATGLALLAFLGAGYTHQEGPYQDQVEKGLYYLTNRMELTDQGGDLGEGVGYAMYPHAIATLALCEAYAMTKDETLRLPAQFAVDFIVYAQHEGGGWRYHPHDPGDTTVTGWQVMALKGALLAGLDVPSPVWFGINKFLDSVQRDDGAFYGYRRPDRDPMNTSIGLLCRMMLGWERDRKEIHRGVNFLGNVGPSENDLYFNYYTAQVMRHYGGKRWKRWNGRLRDYLVKTQSRTGHERGSWQFRERHSLGAGRLYNTTMAIMTLEVYYRFLPLYGDDAVDIVP